MTAWKPCGCLRGSRCNHAAIARDQRRSLARLNRAVAAENREIAAGNRARRRACERAMEWAMRGDLVRARVAIAKLVAAGFSARDGAAIEAMDCAGIEDEMRRLLGLRPSAAKEQP